MQTPHFGVSAPLLAALLLTLAPLSCGGSKEGAGQADGNKAAADGNKAAADGNKAAADGKAAVEAKADGAAAEAGADGGSGGGAAGSGGAAAGSGGVDGGSGGAAAGSGGSGGAPPSDGSSGDDAGAESTGGGVDVKALLKELKKKRTKDARATEIVEQLEAAEVDTLDLAKALTARGKALFADPDRAKAMYELALEKDPKYPDPAFELAKGAAMLGELDEAKKWLKVVKERKGKKLLKQIDFDPMWEIVKDDPEVRALLR